MSRANETLYIFRELGGLETLTHGDDAVQSISMSISLPVSRLGGLVSWYTRLVTGSDISHVNGRLKSVCSFGVRRAVEASELGE